MNLEEIVANLCEWQINFEKDIVKDINNIKEAAIKQCNEEDANFMWCLETVFKIRELYVKTFHQLKHGEYKNAWSNLETIEIMAFSFNRNYLSDNTKDKFHIDWILNQVRKFQKVFPYRIFGSREAIVRKSHCSICGKPFSLRTNCGHVPGKLYMGQMCLRAIDDLQFVAIAIVENPEDKYALMMIDGKEFNYSTLDFLMQYLVEPYEPWDVQIRPVLRNEYRGVGRNEPCPCGSQMKYKKCCLGTESELMDDYHFIFHSKKEYSKQ